MTLKGLTALLAGTMVLVVSSPTRVAVRRNNPPGPRGGRGTNWENPPGSIGGPGASPDTPNRPC